MGCHMKIRMLLCALGSLLISRAALASGDFVIRGDQSSSLLSEVPIEVTHSDLWLTKKSESAAEEKLRGILADIELFTKTDENQVKNPQEDLVNSSRLSSEPRSGDAP
jgi:hypothetical protein